MRSWCATTGSTSCSATRRSGLPRPQPRRRRREWSVGRPPRSVRVPDLLVPATEPPIVDGPAARRRRRVVTAVALEVGTALLAATLHVPHGSAWFTVLGLLVAATWTVGSLVSGPIPFQPEHDIGWRT